MSSSTTLTRRPTDSLTLRRRSLLGGAALLGAGTLAGCGIPSAYVAEDRRSAPDRSERDKRLNFSNWTQYIDTDDQGGRPTLDAFTEKTGIAVTYTEDINDNDEFFGKISPVLTQGADPGRDLMVISDWMAGRYVSLGWVQAMDRDNLPNVTGGAGAACPGSPGSPASRTTARRSAGNSSPPPTCGHPTSRAGSPCSPGWTRRSGC